MKIIKISTTIMTIIEIQENQCEKNWNYENLTKNEFENVRSMKIKSIKNVCESKKNYENELDCFVKSWKK